MFLIFFADSQVQDGGFTPVILVRDRKKNSVSCDYLSGLEAVTDQENDTVKTIHNLYESLLKG